MTKVGLTLTPEQENTLLHNVIDELSAEITSLKLKIEGKILLDSLQRCEIVTTTANNFRDSAKDVLSAATKTAENYTSFYKTISNDPEKSELTEMVNEHLNNLGRCIVKLTNFVQALEAFIGNLGSAVARVGKLITEENEGLAEALEDLKSE